MKIPPLRKILLAPSLMLSISCSVTSTPNASVQTVLAPTQVPPIVAELANTSTPSKITIEKIMSDPDWLGRQPSNARWGLDSELVFYSRKRADSSVSDVWQYNINASSTVNGDITPLSDLHLASAENAVFSSNNKVAAWTYRNSVFLKNMETGEVRQLTKGLGNPRQLSFLTDTDISFQDGSAIYRLSTETGLIEKVLSWQFAEKPTAVTTPPDYIAEEQIKLIEYIAKERQNAQARFDQNQKIDRQNPTIAAPSFYFDKGDRLVRVSLSPNADKAILVTTKSVQRRNDNDIMPNYIKENGRIKAESVRQRVADSKPINHKVWLLDLVKQQKTKLGFESLEGFNEDVLAEVKRENAERKGETYATNRLPRDITLMWDWYWSQSPIQWHGSGEQVAIMLRAWDNKDRWLATVDFANKTLVQQHRLHDKAWINYKFNSFGWFTQSQDLYFISEESGNAHLYRKPLNDDAVALTSGPFQVDNLTFTHDDKHVYFRANKKHPGIYEIYRLNVANRDLLALTNLNGVTSYSLSPDQSTLLLTHSKLNMPPELYLKDVSTDAVPQKITDTVSEEFKSFDWVTPQIVPVPSSESAQPVYSRVYAPAILEKDKSYPAVIFNHGAGYTQDVHLGWSYYFREHMFHSYLVQQGYVVMTMDYRASMGYGRDWRTAIYRQMGTPEIQDLKDGVKWMSDNLQVDTGRVGTYGGSYGGFMTFMALFNAPDVFQAGAALRPVTDWAHYNHAYTSNILNKPDLDPIAYERSSPIYFAEGLENALLINAPMVDDNVFFVDVVRLVQRLIELEKENFETAIHPVEPHGYRQPSSWLDQFRRIYKLFDENLN